MDRSSITARRRVKRSRSSGTYLAEPRFLVLVALLIICALGGGASQTEVLSLLYVYPAAILAIAMLIVLPAPSASAQAADRAALRVPFLLLGMLAMLMVAQLVPLPPGLWSALPGQGTLAEAMTRAGIPIGWRPIALVPEMALASTFDLFVPFAILLGFAGLTETQQARLVEILLAIGIASAVLAVLQISGPSDGPAYIYRRSTLATANGLFANRNHQSVFLAMQLPLLRIWALLAPPTAQARRFRYAAAGVLALFYVPLILMTGSRAGLLAGILGLAAAAVLAPWWRPGERPSTRRIAIGVAILAGVPLLLGGLTIWLGRALTVDRLKGMQDGEVDLRFSNAGTTWQMMRDYFPFGSGFGNFDRLFRIYEPYAALHRNFFNHAHNDVLEIVIAGGLVGALIALGWIIWIGLHAVAAWKRPAMDDPSLLRARAGAAMLFLVVAASLVDYPLRTPLMAAVAALCTGWLACAKRPALRGKGV